MAKVREGKETVKLPEGRESVVIRAVSGDEEGRKKVEKIEVKTHNPDTLRYIEKKLQDKGIQRMDRHPVDGLGGLKKVPKSGHGGKFTWEGPGDLAENELEPAPPALDERDPNYVDEEEDTAAGEGDVGGVVRGKVEVAKAPEAKEGVSRIEFQPPFEEAPNAAAP